MSRRIVRSARALLDLAEAAEFIRQNSPRSALRFLDAAEATFRRLAARPGIGTAYDPADPAFAELRYLPISKFTNHLVFYRADEHDIRIVRVLHGARDLQGLLAEEPGIGEERNEGRPPVEPDSP
jgi:toxin ParE1/3/4